MMMMMMIIIIIIIIIIMENMALGFILDPHNRHLFRYFPQSNFC
jgi:hypothetical protein